MDELKQRVIQESVPGKQVTIAHAIASPRGDIYTRLGLTERTNGAIGVLTTTPEEAIIITANAVPKSTGVSIGFIDRLSGALLITGDVSSTGGSLQNAISVLESVLHSTPIVVTRL